MKKPLQVITNKSEPVSIKRRTDLILFFVLVIDISNNTTKKIETQKNISFRKSFRLCPDLNAMSPLRFERKYQKSESTLKL